MNRKLLALFLLVLLTACSDGNDNRGGSQWRNEPLVETRMGPVQGMEAQRDTWSWKGIPYAEPPLGQMRFRAPQDPAPWSEPFSADAYGERCTQYSQDGTALVGSEDCLTLNVWRPQSEARDLPVYVWIHGGGNSSGFSGEPSYDGANLADRTGVVYVSLNYRLGPLGWLYNPVLRNGDPDTDSGNFGTLDIIKALEWVRDNIERFGGDPDNVFITGESAGGINVLSMVISPRAQGIFDGGMSQSGLLPNIDLDAAEVFSDSLFPPMLVSEGLANDLVEAEALLQTLSQEELLGILQTADPLSIMDPVPKIGVGLLSFPFIFPDGHVIVENGPDSFQQGNYPNKVPLILGTNTGDVRLFLFALAFELSLDMELYNAVADIGGLLWKAAGADEVAASIADLPDQPEVYVYTFGWGRYQEDGSGVTPDPFNYLIGSGHSIDIPFFLGTLDAENQLAGLLFTGENRPGREVLSEEMIGYIRNLLYEGDPNGEKQSQDWYPWSNAEGSPRGIVLDAGFEDLDLGTQQEEVTRQTALDAIEELPPELGEQVLTILLEFPITCAILSDNPSEECVE